MRRAFVVPALLVIATFMVLCVGLISRQPMRNLGAMQSLYQIQARQISLAGIEEARLRLAGDINQGATNTTFSRTVETAPGAAPLGTYVVSFDASWAVKPYYVLRVESEGFNGSPTKPLARYVLRATVDIRAELGPGKPNPKYLSLLRWQESVP